MFLQKYSGIYFVVLFLSALVEHDSYDISHRFKQ